MKRSTRALLGLVILEVAILAGAWWMVEQTRSGAWQTSDQAGAITAITQTAGGAMGLIAVILTIAFVSHKRRGN